MAITGICLGVIIFLVAMAIGVICRKPIKRFPDPPPGYHEWLKKTGNPQDYARSLRDAVKEGDHLKEK